MTRRGMGRNRAEEVYPYEREFEERGRERPRV
jgi:hypothetical protein